MTTERKFKVTDVMGMRWELKNVENYKRVWHKPIRLAAGERNLTFCILNLNYDASV